MGFGSLLKSAGRKLGILPPRQQQPQIDELGNGLEDDLQDPLDLVPQDGVLNDPFNGVQPFQDVVLPPVLEEPMQGVDVLQDDPVPQVEGEAPPGPYTHLSVNTPLYRVGGDGNFQEEALEEYNLVAQELNEAGQPASDQDVRVEMIHRRMQEADGRRAAHQEGLDPGNRAMGMLMLPEWFLGKNLSKDQMQSYRQRLADMSQQYPDTLLQPGTGVWQERVKNSDLGKEKRGKSTVLHSTADVFLGGQQVHTAEKLVNGFDTDHTRGVYGSDKGEVVSGGRAREWYTNNPARTFAGGDMYHANAQSTSSRFEAGGVNFALGICGDHTSANRERREFEGNPDAGADVHLVTSNGAALNDGSLTTRRGGLAINNDAGGLASAPTAHVQSADREGVDYFMNEGQLVREFPWLHRPEGYDGFSRPGVQDVMRAGGTNPHEADGHMGLHALPPRV